MTVAAENARVLKVGLCYSCTSELQPVNDWFVCGGCGRAFRFDGDTVTERIPLDDEWRGVSADISDGARFVLDDDTVVAPERDDHSVARVPASAKALECDWPTA